MNHVLILHHLNNIDLEYMDIPDLKYLRDELNKVSKKCDSALGNIESIQKCYCGTNNKCTTNGITCAKCGGLL